MATCILVGVVLMSVFLGCLLSGFPPIYNVFCLYSQFHRSLFVHCIARYKPRATPTATGHIDVKAMVLARKKMS